MANKKENAHDGVLVAAMNMAFAFLTRPDRAWARDWLLRGLDGDFERDVVALKNTDAFNGGEIVEMYVVATPTPCDDMASSSPRKLCELLQLQNDENTTPSAATFSRFMWMPAHYHGGLTCGVSLQRVNAVAGLPNSIETLPQPGEPGLFAVGRFVREEKTGESLVIATASTAGAPTMAAVSYLMNKSSTRRHHMFLQCNKGLLPGASSQPFHFAQAAVFADVSVTDHDCSVCGNSPLVVPPCQCVPEAKEPSGSLDFAKFRANSQRNLGVYRGKTFLLQRRGPETQDAMRKLSQSVVMTLVRLQGPWNNTIAMSMRALAIQDRLAQSPLRISDGVSDLFENDSVLDFAMEAELEAGTAAELDLLAERAHTTGAFPTGLAADIRVERDFDAQPAPGATFPVGLGVDRRPECHYAPSHLAPALSPDGDIVDSILLDASHQDRVRAGHSRPSQCRLRREVNSAPPALPSNVARERLPVQLCVPETLPFGTVAPAQVLPSHPAYEGPRPAVHAQRSEGDLDVEIKTSVARGDGFNSGPASTGGAACEQGAAVPPGGVQVRPASARGLDRREKNRLAAARSNARRRQERIDLENNVQAATRRKRELSEKHDRLVRENAWLRARLRDQPPGAG